MENYGCAAHTCINIALEKAYGDETGYAAIHPPVITRTSTHLGEIEKFTARLVADGKSQQYGVDSKSCIDLSFDPVSFKKTKHILRAAEWLRDYVSRLVFCLTFIPGKLNMADILTKAQVVAVFNELMREFDNYVHSSLA